MSTEEGQPSSSLLNNPLVRQLYRKNAGLYTDLRKLNTVKRMSNRLIKLQSCINLIPGEQRRKNNKEYRRKSLQKQVVHFKREIYRENRSPHMMLIRHLLQKTDFAMGSSTTTESMAEQEEKKEQHILPILNLMLIGKNDAELQSMINGV